MCTNGINICASYRVMCILFLFLFTTYLKRRKFKHTARRLTFMAFFPPMPKNVKYKVFEA